MQRLVELDSGVGDVVQSIAMVLSQASLQETSKSGRS
jgi:hypothetical protein